MSYADQVWETGTLSYFFLQGGVRIKVLNIMTYIMVGKVLGEVFCLFVLF